MRRALDRADAIDAVRQAPFVALTPLPLESGDAKLFGYSTSVRDVASKFVNDFIPGSCCSNCVLFSGPATGIEGPCLLFPGHTVSHEGWCCAWARKRHHPEAL